MDLKGILKWRQETGGFNRATGIRIVEVTDGGAVAELEIHPEHTNPLGLVHGGALFTLCDATAGTAAASRGLVAVTLSGTINYLHAGKLDQTLRAVAHEMKHGRTTAVYSVNVFDKTDKIIANASFTMFYTDKTVEDML